MRERSVSFQPAPRRERRTVVSAFVSDSTRPHVRLRTYLDTGSGFLRSTLGPGPSTMAQLLRSMQSNAIPRRGTNPLRTSGRSRLAVSLVVALMLAGSLAVFSFPGSVASNADAAGPVHAGPGSPPPILAFNATPNPGEVGVRSHLNVTVLGNITLGDSFSYGGLPSGCVSLDVSNLSCTPTASGTFTVTVAVTNVLGLLQSSFNWTIRGALHATINATASSTPLAVTFHASVTGGVILARIAWKFGDGATSNGSLSANHTYSAAGTYA